MSQTNEAEQIQNGRGTWWFDTEIKALTHAKCYYLTKGYRYALSVVVPPEKKPEQIDAKIHECYSITYVKYKAQNKRRQGEATIKMVRHNYHVLILATTGIHDVYFRNPNVVDLTKGWAIFGRHQIGLTQDKKPKLKIRVTPAVYQTTLNRLRKRVRVPREQLEKEIRQLPWYKSRECMKQKYQIMRHLNREKKIHKQALIRYEGIKDQTKQTTKRKKDSKKASSC